MRPTLSLLNSFFALSTSVQKPLIACGNLGYDQQILPVEVCFHRDRNSSINQESTTGEAEMDRTRSNHTNPNSDSDQSDAAARHNRNHVHSDFEPETIDERLARIKAEIESGVYETPEKLEIAIDRMFGVITD